MNSLKARGWFFLAIVLMSLAASRLYAQGTAFMYQGQLFSGTNPANGTYNLTFALYNVSNGGAATAGPVTTNGVGVTNGLFSVTIDFGSGPFQGVTNWLQIGVASNGVGTFTALSPRQQLTPVPYSIFATTASNVTGMIPAGQISGTVAANLSGTDTNAVNFNNSSNLFTGNGGGLTNLSAWQLTGNAGTTSSNFLGTTDNQPLQFRVGGTQAGLITLGNGGPNIVFGGVQNSVNAGTGGASIMGGSNNTIAASSSFSSIGGGIGNVIGTGASYSFVGGGEQQRYFWRRLLFRDRRRQRQPNSIRRFRVFPGRRQQQQHRRRRRHARRRREQPDSERREFFRDWRRLAKHHLAQRDGFLPRRRLCQLHPERRCVFSSERRLFQCG